MVALAAAGQANAQESGAAAVTPATSVPVAVPAPIAVDDSLTAAIGTSYLDNSIRGFGKAEILGPDGKTHVVWIPINLMGFSKYLPFHRHKEDLDRFGREPFSIDVDKVQSIKLNGLYQEHMILKGKRKHLIATRVVNGPVELFNYTEMVQSGAVMVPVGGVAGAMVMGGLGVGAYPNRSWYLRRQGGELLKVERVEFIAQMTAYFHDDPELVAALRARKVHYREMVKVVQGYNEYVTRPAGTR
ncbi:hypothetical protein GCM10022407_29240 [Hymenobacter antarcticus]|uniref:GLPGLI family protein n=1 Tax=Hymenobacter antarcticus TaxID=486270 RepID=A0ABP7QGD6_9BACT